MKLNTILCMLLFICVHQNHAQDYQTAIEKARFLIEHHKQQTSIPGVQVAVWVKDSMVWSEGFGYSDVEKNRKVTPDTKFRIASISKPLTSLALAKMIQENKIEIDQPISNYLPELPEEYGSITPRQLASSTSGIRHYTSKDPDYNTTDYSKVEASLQKFINDPLLFNPGTDYHYSSYGWVLLSAVMEKAVEQSFLDIMEKTWSDLEMANTTFDVPEHDTETISTFYIYNKRDGRVEAPFENRSFMYAGGGYLSTAEDLIKAGRAMLQKEYVKEEYLDELFKSHRLQNGKETHYGLGWEVGTSRLSTPIVYHSGSMSSARSHFILYPKEEVVFAYLANTGDHVFFNDREAQNVAEIFVEESRKTKSEKNDLTFLEGQWEISTASLRDKKSKGILQLSATKNGTIEGTIEFKRSRKRETYPVILADLCDKKAHLIAVSPMFIDFSIDIEYDTFKGVWLHDFNVKGIPEKDDYWKARKIKGLKVKDN